VPKVEPGLVEENKSTLTSSSLVNVSVKRELEDDFPNDEMECKPVIKTTSSTNNSGDYDEWLEIQKELGVYPSTADTLKCKNGNNNGSSACAVTRSSKIERTRANGECLRMNVANTNVPGVSNTIMKDDCEQDVNTPFDRRWCSATDLERDLSEDTDLDGLALHSQAQCPSSTAHVTSNESGNAGNEHDEINAQVQSAIDSILNLKQRPANTLSGSGNGSSSSQPSDSKDTALDQAVRSILGS